MLPVSFSYIHIHTYMKRCKHLLALFIMTNTWSVSFVPDLQGSFVAGLGKLLAQNLPPLASVDRHLVFPGGTAVEEQKLLPRFNIQRGGSLVTQMVKRLSANAGVKPVSPKRNQPWIFIGRTDPGAEAPVLWPPDMKSQLFEEDPDAGKDWRQEEKGMTEDETVR